MGLIREFYWDFKSIKKATFSLGDILYVQNNYE